MSETTDTTTPPEGSTPDPAPVETPAPAAAEAAPATETPAEGDKPAAEPEQPPKPASKDRRFANLTAKLAHEAAERERANARTAELERELAAAQALIRQAKGEDPTPTPIPTKPADIQAEARKLVEQERFTERLKEIDTKGAEEIGADDWALAKQTMTGLGAVQNDAFLHALSALDNPHKVFATLADDTDTLMDLLEKPPAVMAARLGRMDASLTAPKAPPLSAAPQPSPKVKGSSVPAEPTPYNYPSNMSMKEFNAMMDKWLPPSLGGKRART